MVNDIDVVGYINFLNDLVYIKVFKNEFLRYMLWVEGLVVVKKCLIGGNF